MKGFLVVGGLRFRRLGLATLFAGTAFLLAPAGAIPAAAAKGSSPALRSDLALGAAGEGSEAEGDMVLKQNKRGDRLKLRLRNLEPRTTYEIVDGDTDQVLKTARTNKRGNAKTTLRSAPPAKRGRAAVESSLPDTLEGMNLEIRLAGEDEPVLEGEAPGDGEENGTWSKFGSVCSEPDAAAQVSITMSSWHEAGMGAPYDSICLSVSSGMFWIAEEGGDPANGGDGSDGSVREGGDDGVVFPDIWPLPDMPEIHAIPGPVTFWIRHGNELQQVASVEAGDCYVPLPMTIDNLYPSNGFGFPDGNIFPGDDGEDGGGDDGSGGVECPCPSYYFWCADSTTVEGLPLGVGSVEALQGKEFEVRDGEGNVLLSGELPHMEKFEIEPTPEPLPDEMPDLDKLRELLEGLGIDINIDISIQIGLGDGFSWTFPGSGNR